MYYVCMYACMYLCMCICMCVCMYVYMYVCVYVCVYVCIILQSCSITTNLPYFLHKYLCKFITEPHNVTYWASTDAFCSFCTVIPMYNNVNCSHYVLTVCSQLSVPFCTAIRNYKAAQYAINRQLKSHHQQFSSLHSVPFVSVRSVAANSSVTDFAFRAASCTVSSTVHELYCRCEVFKYSTVCSKMFSCISVK